MSCNAPGIAVPPDLVRPDYNIYQYNDGFYKVVRFNSTMVNSCGFIREPGSKFSHDDKLPQAISRARRMCLEYAICNEWKWFGTLTIASSNYDRKNLTGFYSKFHEWIKYQRKKYKLKIPYLLVPEQHGDGSWHLHGFFNSDIDSFLVSFRQQHDSGVKVPFKLISKDFYNWPDYQSKFGFCSFGVIQDHYATAFYVTKYISKSFQGDAQRVGLRLYYPSNNLNRAQFLDSVYGPCKPLDSCLNKHYEYCSTGFMVFDKQPGDNPILDILESQNCSLYSISYDNPDDMRFKYVDDYYEYTQLCLNDLE